MTDERIGMDVTIKGKKYPLISWYTTIDVDKKRLWCHARLPDTGKEPVSSVSFFIPIEFLVPFPPTESVSISERIT